MVAVHLGRHWRLIIDVVGSRFGIATGTGFRTLVLRALTIGLAAYGVYSVFAVDIGAKLLMRIGLHVWEGFAPVSLITA